jgi:hypothetical protein
MHCSAKALAAVLHFNQTTEHLSKALQHHSGLSLRILMKSVADFGVKTMS